MPRRSWYQKGQQSAVPRESVSKVINDLGILKPPQADLGILKPPQADWGILKPPQAGSGIR